MATKAGWRGGWANIPTGAGVASNARGKGCMAVGREHGGAARVGPGGPTKVGNVGPAKVGTGGPGRVGIGGGCMVGAGSRGGVDCVAITALETSCNQRSASEGVRLCPPCGPAGGACPGLSVCTHEVVAGERRQERA